MRIAICLSGQPRTWKKCYPRWMEIFGGQGEIDFFFHFWDYNTLPRLLETYKGGVAKIEDKILPDDEKEDIITTLNPKKHVFEPRKKIDYWNCDIPVAKKFGPWCIEQFYSLYYASILKREYELEHDFRYDLVMRVRADLWFEDKLILNPPYPSTVYTTHCSWDINFGVYRVGDIFFYADSYTFDQMAQFYKFLSFVPTDWVTKKHCPPPEIAMYFYMASIGLLNHPTSSRIKIMRDQQVLELKGELDGYETI